VRFQLEESVIFRGSSASKYRCGVSPADIYIRRELGIFNITYVFHELTYMFYELDHLNITNSINCRYGVATVSRIDKIIGLFCRIASLL